jgi:hypothetical protein
MASGPDLVNDADDLVPRNDRPFARFKIAFDHVEIRSAYGAHSHPYPYLTWADLGFSDIRPFKR